MTDEKFFEEFKKLGYYVEEIKENGITGWEVYRNNQSVYYASSIEEAYCKLGEFIEADSLDKKTGFSS